MVINRRSFVWENDFEKVREFIGKVCLSGNSYQNWIPSRFENIRFGPCGTEYSPKDVRGLRIWEMFENKNTNSSKIIALAIPDSSTNYYIQTHPDFKYFEKDIIFWIEKQARTFKKNDNQELQINIFALEIDEERKSILRELNYQDHGLCEYNRRRSLYMPIPSYQLPDRFQIRNIQGKGDFFRLKEVLSSVFPHCCKMTENQFNILHSASFYNRELDLVVVAPNESFVAFCTVRMDPLSGIMELEPVGTHPNYRKLGLAKAIISEALKRVVKYHPSIICISGAATTTEANHLYDSLGFTEKTEVRRWQKSI